MGARKRQRDVATPYKPQKPQLAGEMKAVAERLEEDRKSLPIWSARNKLVHLVRENQCLVVVGETGSGKTTQIPQFLLRADVAVSCSTNMNKCGVALPSSVLTVFPHSDLTLRQHK